MRKIKLNVESLTVESFGVAAEATEARGTVHGEEAGAFLTIRLSCPVTCGGSCDSGNPCVYC
jgi:hypothetical protein